VKRLVNEVGWSEEKIVVQVNKRVKLKVADSRSDQVSSRACRKVF
jgi:hypothetical protein